MIKRIDAYIINGTLEKNFTRALAFELSSMLPNVTFSDLLEMVENKDKIIEILSTKEEEITKE